MLYKPCSEVSVSQSFLSALSHRNNTKGLEHGTKDFKPAKAADDHTAGMQSINICFINVY